MKRHVFVVLAACLMLGGSVSATDMLMEQGVQGCQMLAAFDWMVLGPGERWTETIDMTGCTDEQIGSYYYYGFIAKKASAPMLKVRNGIVLTVTDLTQGTVYTCSGNKGDREAILLNPCSKSVFEISAENTSKKSAKVRLTWNNVTTR